MTALELRDRLPDLERQADELERKAQALRQIIAGVRALNGDGDAAITFRSFEAHRTSFEIAPPSPHGPRGPQAVLRVMAEDPHRAWKVVELKREMLRRGWAPSPKAVEASVKRLREQERIVQTSTYGFYKLAQPDEPAYRTDDGGDEGVRSGVPQTSLAT
jgi:hypothetical protein